MTSVKTQLPYEYYSLPFCQPESDVHYKSLNLGKVLGVNSFGFYYLLSLSSPPLPMHTGEVLRGDRIVNTPYQVSGL